MRIRTSLPAFLAASALVAMAWAGRASAAPPADGTAARTEAKKVLDLMYKVRAYQKSHPWRPVDRNWIRATYYTGVMGMYHTTKDPKVLAQALRWAEKHQWREGNERHPANKKTCGQTYLELYFLDPKPERIAAIRAYVDSRMRLIAGGESPLKGWYYVDTLYVGPPTLAMLAKATGQKKYADYLHKVYWTVAVRLLDRDDGLFYRDARYFKARTKRGKKVFWSRGNGWAFGGIPRVLAYLPKEDPQRPRYVKLLRTMAKALVARQPADGLWRSNLDDADQHPNPETSGTAFFCYGLAWGVNQGLLDRKKYLPATLKAWAGLVRHVNDSGRLGYVQPVGADPRPARANQTHEYAAGLFLLAGGEIHRLLTSAGGASVAEMIRRYAKPPPKAAPLPASAPANLKTFARNGGWCWFQDPRAIIHDGKLIIGSVSGAGKQRGDVRASVYDLKAGRDLGTVVLAPKFQSDDHDTPAFYARPDGRILAVYARHSSGAHYTRISDPKDPTRWAPVQAFKHPRSITYMNLYYHAADKTLYNFYRDTAGSYCPAYLVSKDHGQTWQKGAQLIHHGMKGRHRPYTRYWSDGQTIHVAFTEAHPQELRNAGCGIYYAKFKAGTVYRADGTRIKDVRTDGPLKPAEAERVFAGSVSNSAWTSAIRTDAKGQVTIAYSVRKTRDDHRFRYAVWNGKAWTDRQIAYAGPGLYPGAYDYTGLVTIDPTNPARVYLSTNVDPAKGTRLASGKHEIYEASCPGPGKPWTFAPITSNSPVANLRPICLAGEGWRVLLWLRGRYTTYTDFDQDVVGIVETIDRAK